jgi:AcrR family transcriptional regulator
MLQQHRTWEGQGPVAREEQMAGQSTTSHAWSEEWVPVQIRPQQDRAARTRSEIIVAAARLFDDKGFPATSISDIANEVGMTKGAVYFHFRNKEDIALEVVRLHYAGWPDIIAEVRAEGLPPLETIKVLVNRVAREFRDNIVVKAGARLQAERNLIGASLPQPYVGWTQVLTEMFTSAEEAGQLRAGVSPAVAARTFVAAFHGVQHVSDVLTSRADLTDRWTELRELLFFAISARPSS